MRSTFVVKRCRRRNVDVFLWAPDSKCHQFRRRSSSVKFPICSTPGRFRESLFSILKKNNSVSVSLACHCSPFWGQKHSDPPASSKETPAAVVLRQWWKMYCRAACEKPAETKWVLNESVCWCPRRPSGRPLQQSIMTLCCTVELQKYHICKIMKTDNKNY